MTEQVNPETLFIECECTTLEHTMRFTYWKEEDPSEDRVYVHIYLYRASFLKRLVCAVKYLFGYRSKYGDFDEVIIDPTKAKQIIALLSRLK